MAKVFLVDIDMSGVARVINLPAPSASTDAATKGYVDALVEGLQWKANVRAASTANVNTASPGASMDSVLLSVGDRVLLKNQTALAENGIYVWNGAAVALTRAADASTGAELVNAITTVSEGTANADTAWRQDAIGITLGSTAISWVAFGSVSPAASETTAGIAEIATQAEVDAGTDDLRIVTPLKLKTWASAPKRNQSSVGDGSATQFTLTHNLGTRDVLVAVYQSGSPWADVMCDVERPTVNSVLVRFSAAPTAGQYRVVILG